MPWSSSEAHLGDSKADSRFLFHCDSRAYSPTSRPFRQGALISKPATGTIGRQRPIFRESGETAFLWPGKPGMPRTKKVETKRINAKATRTEAPSGKPIAAEPSRVGKRGTVVIPAALRRHYGIEEGTLVIAEPREGGVLIRPALLIPVEVYTPERKAQFILSNAIDADDYVGAGYGSRNGPRPGHDPSLQAPRGLRRGPGLPRRQRSPRSRATTQWADLSKSLHRVTVREMYNLARAAESSWRGRGHLSSTLALSCDRRSPCFPGFPWRAAGVLANPGQNPGVQKVELARFSRLFRSLGLRKRAEVELRRCTRSLFVVLRSRIREHLLDATLEFPIGLSPGGAAVNSPGREPWVLGGRGETSPSPGGATEASGPALSPLRGSGVGVPWPVPGLTPWAIYCRPSGAKKQTST